MKQGYYTRLIPFTVHDDIKALFFEVERLNLVNEVVNMTGAIPLLKYKHYSENQQFSLYQNIKDALVTIKAKG